MNPTTKKKRITKVILWWKYAVEDRIEGASLVGLAIVRKKSPLLNLLLGHPASNSQGTTFRLACSPRDPRGFCLQIPGPLIARHSRASHPPFLVTRAAVSFYATRRQLLSNSKSEDLSWLRNQYTIYNCHPTSRPVLKTTKCRHGPVQGTKRAGSLKVN